MRETTRRRLLLAARVVFGVAIIVVLVAVAARNGKELRKVHFQLSPGWLLVAAPFTFAGGVLLPLAWRQTLKAYGAELPPATAVRVWCLSQASRFIPGNVALVASRVLLSSREGVPKSLAATSLALEGGMIVVWGGFFAAWLPSSIIPGPLRLLMALGALVVLVALPKILRVFGRLLPRFPALSSDALRPRHLYEAVALYGLNNLMRACGFVFVAAALHTIDLRDVWLIIAAVNLGAVLGMIGITPAGIGVREGVIGFLLHDRFGKANATAFAVAFRAWDFAFELLWLGLALLWERRSRQRASTTGTP